MGRVALLVILGLTLRAHAAISEGPKYTNAVVAEQQRILQFYQAEQSFQEKLKVGRERYNLKQVNRGKVIAAMSAELQARQQTVGVQPVVVPDAKTNEPVPGSGPWLAVALLAIGVIGFKYYQNTQRA
jgi:hypothetical protein